jgi:hypothetical protein
MADFHVNEMAPTSYPAYSPDLVPSNFNLFGHAKGQLTSGFFSLTEELLAAINRILGKNPLEVLKTIF